MSPTATSTSMEFFWSRVGRIAHTACVSVGVHTFVVVISFQRRNGSHSARHSRTGGTGLVMRELGPNHAHNSAKTPDPTMPACEAQACAWVHRCTRANRCECVTVGLANSFSIHKSAAPRRGKKRRRIEKRATTVGV